MAVSTKVQTTEIEVISKNHQILVMELDLSVVKRRKQCFIYIGTLQGYNEKKNLESELKEEKCKLDNIVSEIGADLLVIDRNSKICWANKRLIENHPLGKNILNRTCFDTYCHFKSAPTDCPSSKVFKTGKINQTEHVVYNKHKKIFLNAISSPSLIKTGMWCRYWS